MLTETLSKPVEEKEDEFAFIDESNVKDVTTKLFHSSIGEACRKRHIVSNIDLPERIKTLLVIENPVHRIEFDQTAKGAPLMLFDNFKYLINKITTSVNSEVRVGWRCFESVNKKCNIRLNTLDGKVRSISPGGHCHGSNEDDFYRNRMRQQLVSYIVRSGKSVQELSLEGNIFPESLSGLQQCVRRKKKKCL